MSDKKKLIKQDILDNLDEIVDILHDTIYGELDADAIKVDDLATGIFETLADKDKKMSEFEELEYALGKEKCPDAIKDAEGNLQSYNEIDIQHISNIIPCTNEIFTDLYKWKYEDGMAEEDFPKAIQKVLDVYRLLVTYNLQKKTKDFEDAKSWLISVGLVGSLRFQGKANSPYLLDDEIERLANRFIKNIENLNKIVNNFASFYDKNKNGFAIFDTVNSYRKREIEIFDKYMTGTGFVTNEWED